MSNASGVGAQPAGVVRNSALSFVTHAPPVVPPAANGVNTGTDDKHQIRQADRLVPAGLKSLCEACSRLYPDQPNPLQVTTRLKYWLGGHDPLDYISMYWNPGKPEEHIPSHWHYISFGLSDLHGDGRVHPTPDRVALSAGAVPSGCGFELTLRLAAEAEPQPPLWPAALLQALARYVFTTGNKLCAGDHISWHHSLDGGPTKRRLRHLLVASDPQLQDLNTPHGTVSFLQVVGCTGRELKAAQRGSGFDVLKRIGEDPNCGGSWLVTRLSRSTSARRVRTRRRPTSPAPLAGVSARVRWHRITQESGEPASPSELPASLEQQIKDTLQRGLTTMSTERSGPEGHMSTDSFEMACVRRALPHISGGVQSSWQADCSVEYLDGVHIVFNAEAASLLPLAIDGRVLRGSHFTWRECGRCVSLLAEAVSGAVATPLRPYAAAGSWLQVVLQEDLAQDISRQVSSLGRLADSDSEPDSEDETGGDPPALPLVLSWPKHRLKISVLNDTDFV